MKSIHNLGDNPAGLPIAADDLLEFHAGRLLLLFRCCGTAGRIDGLTKMAKLDFFVRYPQFFNTACKKLGLPSESVAQSVESSMIRFHYGPWDDRYYHVLAYLEAKGLISASKDNKAFTLALTDQGKDVANGTGQGCLIRHSCRTDEASEEGPRRKGWLDSEEPDLRNLRAGSCSTANEGDD